MPAGTDRPSANVRTCSAARSCSVVLAIACLVLSACGSGGSSEEGSGSIPEGLVAESCLVRLHGRSASGQPPEEQADWTVLSPDANREWSDGGRVWIYDTDDEFEQARSIVLDAVEQVGCDRVVLHGFSNGGGFLGKLLCSGEDLDGRLVGAVVDDPVPDDSSPECSVADGVEVVVYWTGALTEATPGSSCEEIGWTCAGSDQLVGVEEYATRLGAPVSESIHTEHVPYDSAPEIDTWFSG